ncbi:MAG: AAA family ATPase, partial [Nitrospirae bacterium]
ATSRSLDLPHLALWAAKKGIAVVGTGDITHPAWRQEAREQLLPAGPGLFRLLPEGEREVARRLPAACRATVRFMLTGEISTIYKRDGRTRKVHHLVLFPGFHEVERLVARLERIGNLHSDGRPILGLDSRDLLELCLEAGEGVTLIPAHVWTPWFSALGSKSGFDSVEQCYRDLAPHIFAVETGLSADPPMCWRVSGLDRYRLVSHSDAHSADRLGREATRYETPLDYFAMRRALETGAGFGGTVEFFPEEGKYHLDGHRACSMRLTPEETRAHGGRCPACGKPVTVGVLSRVEALADRPAGARPPVAAPYRCLVPLPEILAEIHGVGPRSKRVAAAYEGLLERLGPELPILEQLPVEAIRAAATPLLAEAIARLRAGRVHREGGYDGAYGSVHLFEPGEVARAVHVASLFPEEEAAPAAAEPAPEGQGAPAA